ncbi:alkaline phosphatase family protein [Flavobacterium sp. JP2137]|uniref:alkaline phosphatase family protein n=1 Tax=Flavobacterium sp. JP2137 TaxID=3414510 RepID=UPI003D2FCCD7
MKKNVLTVLAICFLAYTSYGQQIKHVILVSIDGFRPDFYTEEHWGTPNLKWMAANGVQATAVRTIFPSVTYPSHTTLATAALPYKHGVYYNTQVNSDGTAGEWIYDSKDIKVPTIWQRAKEKGLTTASVSWPVTLHNPYIDYNLPEIWDFKNPSDRIAATKKGATPAGLFEEVLQNALGNIGQDQFNLSSLAMDENLGRSAAYLIKKYQPHLLTLHLPCTDGAQHSQGRAGQEVDRAIAGADKAVGNLLDAIAKAGLTESTVVIITGDHGFVSTDFSLAPNIWLKEAGLSDKAYFFTSGGSTALHITDKKDQLVLQKVEALLEALPNRYKALFEVISQKMIRERGGEPEIKLALSAKLGYAFNNLKEGKVLTQTKGGKHGYFPNFKEIYTGFIAYGPTLKKGMVVEAMNLEDIPVIISDLLGFEMRDVDGIGIPISRQTPASKK